MHSAGVRFFIRLAAIVVAVLAVHRYVCVPWQVNGVLYIVQQRTKIALDAGPDRALQIARGNIDRLLPFAPDCTRNVDYFLLLAANARLVGNREMALEEYTAALSADRRPEIYFNRGMTYFESGNVEAAMPDFVRAARFSEYVLDSMDGELRTRVRREAGLQE